MRASATSLTELARMAGSYIRTLGETPVLMGTGYGLLLRP